MSNEDVTSGDADQVSSGDDQSKETTVKPSGTDTVAYETYQKAMSDLKRFQKESREKALRLEQLEQEKLGADGKKDELIESWKKKASSYEKQVTLYAKKQLTNQVMREAEKLGSVDGETVAKLLDLNQFELDLDTFETDPAMIKSAIEDLRRLKPFLFSKTAAKVNSDLPGGGEIKPKSKKAPNEMTREEILAELKSLR